jgi:hypothetical protein
MLLSSAGVPFLHRTFYTWICDRGRVTEHWPGNRHAYSARRRVRNFINSLIYRSLGTGQARSSPSELPLWLTYTSHIDEAQ